MRGSSVTQTTQRSGGAPAAPMTGSRPNLPLLITPCDKTAHGKVPMAHVLRAAVQSSRCQGALQPRVQGAASAVVLHCGSHSCVPNLKAEIFGCLIAEGGDGPAVAGSRGHPQPPVCRDAPFAAVTRLSPSQRLVPFPAGSWSVGSSSARPSCRTPLPSLISRRLFR